MADPIAWQIQEDVKAAIEAVDGTGDYFYDFSASGDVKYRVPQTNNHAPGKVLLWSQSVERKRDSEPSHKFHWNHTFVASYRADPANADTPEEQLHKARADIEAAVMADPMRGQLAFDTQPDGAEYLVEEDARFEVQVRFVVWYDTSEANPTTQT